MKDIWENLKAPEFYRTEIDKLKAQIAELENLEDKAHNKKKLAELGTISEEDEAVFREWMEKGFDGTLALKQVELARKERETIRVPEIGAITHRSPYSCG